MPIIILRDACSSCDACFSRGILSTVGSLQLVLWNALPALRQKAAFIICSASDITGACYVIGITSPLSSVPFFPIFGETIVDPGIYQGDMSI
jgi:hypothetical protein